MIVILYNNTYGLEELKLKRIVNCIREASCPNEALRGVTHRFKRLEYNDSTKTYTVYLDSTNTDDFHGNGVIYSISI